MEYSSVNNKKQNDSSKRQEETASSQGEDGKFEARIASILLLIASLINNVTEDDNLFVLAAVIGLIAVILLYKAALLEARAQQIAPGVTTFANRLKILGSTASILVNLILFWALLIEVQLRREGVSFPRATASGTAGAFLV